MTAPAPAPPPAMEKPKNALVQLWLSREREFLREPGVLFWVFGFPILLAVALGIAFRSRGPETSAILFAAPRAGSVPADALEASLASAPLLSVTSVEEVAARARFARGDALVLVTPGPPPTLEFDPSRPGARAAALAVKDAIERAAGRKDVASLREVEVSAPGRRYIDFLIPGLLGMSLMSGGIWGVGWGVVNLRIKRLLKRLASTPMGRSDFLISFLLHRFVVAFVESAFLLAFGAVAFGVAVRGSLATVFVIAMLGAASFAGLGLLVGSRARNAETANGLMNLATLPMWLLSGVFFSTSNFPGWMRPAVDALPLTALNDALRATMGEGAGLAGLLGPLAILAVWGVGSYLMALRWFRWQ